MNPINSSSSSYINNRGGSGVDFSREMIVLEKDGNGKLFFKKTSRKFSFFKKIASFVSDFFYNKRTIYFKENIELYHFVDNKIKKASAVFNKKSLTSLRKLKRKIAPIIGKDSRIVQKIKNFLSSPLAKRIRALNFLKEHIKEKYSSRFEGDLSKISTTSAFISDLEDCGITCFFAVEKDDEELLKLLLLCGMDVDKKNPLGKTALDIAKKEKLRKILILHKSAILKSELY